MLGVLCVGLALYFSPLSASANYAIATHEVSPFWIRLFPNGAFILMLPGLIIGVVAPCFVLISLGNARFQGAKLTSAVGYAALVWLASWLNFAPLFWGIKTQQFWPQRRAGLQQATARARPLIGAIEQFRLENKRVPHTLQELVPNYLAEIPQTGMAAYPQFLYDRNAPAEGYFQTYEVKVRTGFGFAYDSFNYWPEGDYPAQMYGGRIERVGDWAYLHE